ncbi:hypothetical protein G7K_4499-t1 [Saitoella complicata NRRL Y-17804]|uniref:Uncharacterized protein n=1 Tax=Saitoella complicata (strain BCRC 22490 / CBS 7301 / JCM 7358 / NBRC 10748 / NRRL Y-17804) TaxID=698492 RepID=A0A0E9NKI5_SAICN|nr:hypothetical protein G7K_4499-t1 [Saitoella complicata NRRL Y-17804]
MYLGNIPERSWALLSMNIFTKHDNGRTTECIMPKRLIQKRRYPQESSSSHQHFFNRLAHRTKSRIPRK